VRACIVLPWQTGIWEPWCLEGVGAWQFKLGAFAS